LIIFFASWCEFCKGEIEKYLQKVKSGDCDRVSFVSVDGEETALQNYLKAHPDFKGPIYWDKQKKLKQSLEVSRLPQVVYLARDKNIYRVENGAEKTGRQIDFIIADAEGRHGTCQ
jgi:thiol-disulfide isomerase/thioredoxin